MSNANLLSHLLPREAKTKLKGGGSMTMSENILKFQDIDLDRSGGITLDTFKKAMRANNPSVNDQQVALRFSQIDVNGTGHVSEEDYNTKAAILEIETHKDGINSGKTFRLQAKTLDDVQEWGQAIENAVIDAKTAAEKV